MMKIVSILGIALSLCVIAGCGNDWQAPTHPASGKVTVNGTPANGAVITLHAVNQKVDIRNSRPYGIADARGTFNLRTYEAGDGAPVGEYDVTVTWPLDVTKMELAMVDQLDGKFARPAQSQWKVNITDGENIIPNIDITNVKLKTKNQSSAQRRLPRGPEMGNSP